MKIPKCLELSKTRKRVYIDSEKDAEQLSKYLIYLADKPENKGKTIESIYLQTNIKAKKTIYHLAEKYECVREALDYIKARYSEWLDNQIVETLSKPNVQHKNLNLLIYLIKNKHYRDSNDLIVNAISDSPAQKSFEIEVVEDDVTDYYDMSGSYNE